MTARSVVDVATEGTKALPDEEGGTNADDGVVERVKAATTAAAEEDRRTMVYYRCCCVCRVNELVRVDEL